MCVCIQELRLMMPHYTIHGIFVYVSPEVYSSNDLEIHRKSIKNIYVYRLK